MSDKSLKLSDMEKAKMILKFVGVFTPILAVLCVLDALRYFYYFSTYWMRGSICIAAAVSAYIFGYAIYHILKNSIAANEKNGKKIWE